MGWILSCLQFDGRVLSYVSTISSSPTMILFILAGVMIVTPLAS